MKINHKYFILITLCLLASVLSSACNKKDSIYIKNNGDEIVSFTEATLGAEVEIPTLDGKEKYTIPEGTETGTEFILKDRGISDTAMGKVI